MKSKEYKEILKAYETVYEQRVGVETKNPDETLQQMVDRQGLGGKVVKSGKLQKSHYEPSGDSINESHFKVGDEVICKKSGMEGEVVKVDSEEKGKYYTVKREDGKTMKYAPSELKLESEKEEKEEKKGGASKKAETKFHTKLDKLVHKTFGSSPEEKKMKEELELDEARAMSHSGGTPHPLQGDGSRPRGMGGKTFGIEDLPPPAKRKDVKDVKEEVDIFDVILEHLVAEGYADTNQAALVIMANMSESWKQSILEMDDFAAGGGNAKMKQTGMSRDQVISLGKKNLAAKPSTSSSGSSSSSGRADSSTPSDVVRDRLSSREKYRDSVNKSIAAGVRGPAELLKKQAAQDQESKFNKWYEKNQKPGPNSYYKPGYKNLAGTFEKG